MVTSRHKLNKFVSMMKTLIRNKDELTRRVSSRSTELEKMLEGSDEKVDEVGELPNE